MPDSYHPPTFHVHASNIHTSENRIYGPFEGLPGLTYESLRATCRDDEPPEVIFTWIDPEDINPGNPHDYDTWYSPETETVRYDGWRRCDQHFNLTGPFWTDLVIVTDRES